MTAINIDALYPEALAREAKLRNALEWIGLIFQDDTLSQERDPELWLPSVQEALSQPTDDTALKQIKAEYEAREAKLRETLEESKDFFDSEVGSSHLFRRLTIKDIEEALSLPTDDTVLREMITKAGEVMRERCAEYVGRNLMDCRSYEDAIRALPGITLEDLK